MNAFEELQWRGLVYDYVEGVPDLLEQQKITIYNGFDATADSLHVGHLVPLMALARLQRFGHTPIALAGGGTSMIGDPSGKTGERQLLSRGQIEANVEAIKGQLAAFLDFEIKTNPARLLNNADWLLPLHLVDFLRDTGKFFTVNYMITKDSVKNRLEREDGISFTEFSYMLLQAYDFYHLHEHHGCAVQAGGKDQWGNITAGIDLIRRMSGGSAHGLTFPLLTTASGVKIGKTEGASGSEMVWLDPEMTSPYQMYQYWVNTDDLDVVKFLKLFTFLDLPEITELEESLKRDPGKREPHHRLAFEFTRLAHGGEAGRAAQEASEVLFGSEVQTLSQEVFAALAGEVPGTKVSKARVQNGVPLVDLLLETNLVKSKRAARDLIGQGGAYVNNKTWKDLEGKVGFEQALSGRGILLRVGKKNYHLLMIE